MPETNGPAGETQVVGETAKRLGSLQGWVVSRIIHAFMLVAWLTILASHASWQFKLEFTGVFALVTWVVYPIAYGSASQEGISFRRYFKTYYFPWDEVIEGRWGSKTGWGRLKLTFREPAGLSSTAEFNVINNIWQLFKAYRGWRPEIVDWVSERLSDRWIE